MITASLVLGLDGATTLNGSSRALSSARDRDTFLARRRRSDCILIGGRTANSEGYAKSPVPLIILSHSRPLILETNPLARWWMMSPEDAIEKAKTEFGEAIAIEGGIHFILPLLAKGAIDRLYLSVCSPIGEAAGGENKVSLKELTDYFEKVDKTIADESTTYYECSSPKIIQNLK